MLATLVEAGAWLERDRTGWIFERKLDGLRCIAVRDGQAVQLWSRNHNSFLDRFPEVAVALRSLSPPRFSLDGELVAHDGRDFVGFGQLQQHGSRLRTVFCVFDVLELDGRDTTSLPLRERKKLLSELMADSATLQLVSELTGSPDGLLSRACESGWEGLIAKRADGAYVSGRSSDWVKLKCSASQELVIGGWTEPRGARTHLGALLVGYYEEGQLRYAGKVGTGFTGPTLAVLAGQLAPLERAESPFVDKIRQPGTHWVEPRLVANIGFSEWTRDGRLRHPRFEGLRPDKAASEVARESKA
jgi:bifunctional non-homologous end joining protein LigD